MNGYEYVSLLTVGVAYIAGKGGVAFITGGFLRYWVLAPVLDLSGLMPVDPETASSMTDPDRLQQFLYRPVGIGMLIGGAVAGVLMALPLIVTAIKSMQNAAKSEAALARDEMPIKLLYFAIAGATLLLVFMAVTSTEQTGWGRGIVMGLVGVLWIWIAGVILSEAIGRTNWSPLSGMTDRKSTRLNYNMAGIEDLG